MAQIEWLGWVLDEFSGGVGHFNTAVRWCGRVSSCSVDGEGGMVGVAGGAKHLVCSVHRSAALVCQFRRAFSQAARVS